MAARYTIVRTRIPQSGITALRALSRGSVLEPLITHRFAVAYERWLNKVADASARKYPKVRGKSARSITGSARVKVGRNLNSLEGYFLVDPEVAAHEYGAFITPKKAKKLAIPMPDALRPDGAPKRRGPNSWRTLGSFIYKAKSGRSFIVYRSKTQGKLIFLYMLVDSSTIREKRVVRTEFDKALPRLYRDWTEILREEISRVYSIQLAEQMKSANPLKNVPVLPVRMPSATTHSSALLPRYRKS